MSLRLTCPLGHVWEEADALPGKPARCPVCGAEVATHPSGGVNAAPLPGEEGAPTVAHPPDWQPLAPVGAEAPPTLADFEILGELGRGGMGIVYKARWRREDRVIALKVIRQDRLQHAEAVRRFRREAQAAARLHHPNIVRVFDSDHSGDTHYLVMEYVDGVTLERLVQERGPLPLTQACDYMRQAALGLQHAHDQALVHRDIKPANLMIAPRDAGIDGAAGVVKILDMGVARVLQLGGAPAPGDSFSTLTQGGTVIGTADYIAPEQLEDPHKADIRADLYSLGCTFYFVLTGQVPFPGGSLVSKLDKQRWQVPTSVDELRVDVPAAVAAVIRQLLAKQPADRYRTPAELAEALGDLARSGFTDARLPRRPIPERLRLAGHTESVAAVAIAPDGRHAVSGGKDRVVRVWDLAAGQWLRSFSKQTQEIRAAAFAPDGALVAWAAGVAVRLGNPHTGLETRRIGGHTDAVRAVAFAANGQRLVSAAEDRTVRFWDVPNGREIQRMARHSAGVTCCAVDAAGNVALSGSRDQTLRLWDLRHGQALQVMTPNAGAVLSVALTPDARCAVSAHFDTLVRLWDMASGRELRRFQGHKQMVTAVALTPDGNHLVTASQDQTIRLWQLDTGLELANAALATGITALALAPDGKQALAAGADRSLILLELPIRDQ
ncbi:MAG: serine/threonine protein kinase [Gemmataceae bacterium]|nr:serine/threonine protein kinase [Gemmataceae bacterium]